MAEACSARACCKACSPSITAASAVTPAASGRCWCWNAGSSATSRSSRSSHVRNRRLFRAAGGGAADRERDAGGAQPARPRRAALAALGPERAAARAPVDHRSAPGLRPADGERPRRRVDRLQRRGLRLAGRRRRARRAFRTRSDTEFILRGYEAWGIDGLLERLRGMFAFGILDIAKGKAYLARDRMGEKPLVYCLAGGELAFGSTVRSRAAVPAARQARPFRARHRRLPRASLRPRAAHRVRARAAAGEWPLPGL